MVTARASASAANPIVIQTTALPPINSGEILNFPLQFTGGSGGPYILELIDGALPSGVGLDNQTVSLVGRPLENGTFDFTVKLTDTGSQPFAHDDPALHVGGGHRLARVRDRRRPARTGSSTTSAS